MKSRIAFFGIFFLANLVGCGPSEKERMTIAALTTDMKPHCVGRYLIDLPKVFFDLGVDAESGRFLPPNMDFQEAPHLRLEVRAQGQTEVQYVKAVEQVLAEYSVPGREYQGGVPRPIHRT